LVAEANEYPSSVVPFAPGTLREKFCFRLVVSRRLQLPEGQVD
jgi:hypothetical protein